MTDWWTVEEAPGYEISDNGDIRRYGKILKPAPNTQGYLHVTLCHKGSRKTRTIHSIVCKAFHGPRPTPSHDAAHWDGDKTNNRANNLRWATKAENQADRIRHGTVLTGDKHPSRLKPECLRRGERHPMRKLSAADVIAIRTLPIKQVEAAKMFKIAQSNVSDIRRGIIWREVA